MKCRVFSLQKRDHLSEEYEDASDFNLESGGFAVADGAAESGFARSWAEILVKHFVALSAKCLPPWETWLPAAQQSWIEGIGDAELLPWYAEAKFRQGAFATFLGLIVTPREDGAVTWHATAVGDSCLFHTRGAKLLKAFPLERSEEFDTHPMLVGSRTPAAVVEEERAVAEEGSAESRDRLWMMTDALSHWFLAEHEADNDPWTEFESLMTSPDSEERITERIAALRKSKELRNDDVTLLVVGL